MGKGGKLAIIDIDFRQIERLQKALKRAPGILTDDGRPLNYGRFFRETIPRENGFCLTAMRVRPTRSPEESPDVAREHPMSPDAKQYLTLCYH